MAQSFDLYRQNTCCSHSHRPRCRCYQFCRRQPRLPSRRCRGLGCHPLTLHCHNNFSLPSTPRARGD
ncbi:hypothetical protein GUJ93_ZPchr0006g42880 [Zizania palustris]|uniref:Uncharacterized protein n=1 Tax=Zizania palustris TaxID=103762 RepID=A0A8J5T1X7_ZIZPA|nr:hypothetical protein GUJ93_ZPchr0006g42880 [Zizania palustris]